MHIIRNGKVTQYHRCATKGTVPTNLRATRYTDATCHGSVGANHAVMRNLNLVIQLDAIFDHGVIQRAAVDCRVGTDLDIIANLYATHLGNLDPVAALIREAKAISANDSARLNDATLTNTTSRQKTDPWM